MSGSTATILIVDDIEANRLVLHELCLSLGHRPVVAENGRIGLDLIRAEDPDLVLLDIMMPELDGFGVLEQMKEDAALRHLPVIMITAVDELDSVVRCIEAGADDYLVKPFDPTLLKARMNSCLEKKRLRDQEQKLHADLTRSYDALRRAEQARDALVHMIVHDLNNPLTGILGYSEMLTRGGANEEKQQRYAEQIKKSGEEMAALVRGILDVYKLESGDMRVSLAPVDLVALARTVCEQLKPQAKALNIDLQFDFDGTDASVSADEELLRRVIQNLVSNALKHSGRGTEVSVSIQRNQDQVVLVVKDNGDGIPREYQEMIFDKFFQMQARKEGKKYGVGLGLTFCKMAIEAQGGRIWVESETGKGSLFKAALRAAP